MLGGHQCDEELREVEERVDEGEGQKHDEKEPLVAAGLADVWQDVVEGLDLRAFAFLCFHGLHHHCHFLELCGYSSNGYGVLRQYTYIHAPRDKKA